MEALDLILQRASVPARQHEDAPVSQAALENLLRAAMTAPDHGLLRPYRFLVIRGEARERLGEVFAEAARLRDPDMDPALVEKDRQKPLRSPLIIAVVAVLTPGHPKAPEVEQILTAGMAGYNMVLAAQAMGLGAIWLSGTPAYDGHVLQALGIGENETLVGYVYVGQPKRDFRGPRRPDWTDFTREWTAPGETA